MDASGWEVQSNCPEQASFLTCSKYLIKINFRVSKFSARSTVMQYCPAKASKILQNEWHCPAYTNTRPVGKYAWTCCYYIRTSKVSFNYAILGIHDAWEIQFIAPKYDVTYKLILAERNEWDQKIQCKHETNEKTGENGGHNEDKTLPLSVTLEIHSNSKNSIPKPWYRLLHYKREQLF